MTKVLSITLFIVALITLSGCYKNDIVHTYHPESGLVIVAVEPPVLEDGETMPTSYFLEVNGVRGEVVDGQVTFASLVEPGEYGVRIYNETNAIFVDEDGVASSPYEESVTDLSDSHVYFGSGTITISADYNDMIEIHTTAVTRKLTFEIEVSEGDVDKVSNIELNFSGVASSWHCIDSQAIGSPKSVKSEFEIVSKSEATAKSGDESSSTGYYLTSSLYLLGTLGTEQSLTAVVHYENGNTQTISSDVSDMLTAFNDDKSTAKILQSTTTLLSESSFTATITDWVDADESFDFEIGPGEEL